MPPDLAFCFVCVLAAVADRLESLAGRIDDDRRAGWFPAKNAFTSAENLEREQACTGLRCLSRG